MNNVGGRLIYWKCVDNFCKYSLVTRESHLRESDCHNHEAKTDLLNRKHVRAKIRENLENGLGTVKDVLKFVKESDGDEIGNIEAFKQSVRRINRKLVKKEPKPENNLTIVNQPLKK